MFVTCFSSLLTSTSSASIAGSLAFQITAFSLSIDALEASHPLLGTI